MSVQRRKNGEVAFIFERKPSPTRVFLVGDFNDWNPNAKRMVRSKDGSFRARLQLTPGDYEFRFLVDGQWVSDPTTEQQQNPFGSSNSIVRVA